MVKINYQAFGNKGFKLRLRLYKDGETKYVVVHHLLKGDIKKKHWDSAKQEFTEDCPSTKRTTKFSENSRKDLLRLLRIGTEAYLVFQLL